MDAPPNSVPQLPPDGADTAPRGATPPSSSSGGGVKETIESILIAFILAFIFRAFVVEAFVIPTGSMAPTLLGAHMRYKCPDCGYDFTVNYSSSQSGDDPNIPRFVEPVRTQEMRNGVRVETYRPKTFHIRCPNCSFRIGDETLSDPRHEPGTLPPSVTNSPVHYGDRILVLKYQYLFEAPNRWDVVVFKSPLPPGDTPPERYDYSVNYIKRLVGLPGESVMVLDGDVYTAPSGATNLSDFVVRPKPYMAQEALWRVVYDNDYRPRELKRADRPWVQPWTKAIGGEGWDLGAEQAAGRAFRFNNPTGAGAIYFDGAANPFPSNRGERAHAFTDWLAYDVTLSQQGDRYRADCYNSPIDNINANVSDVKLALTYERRSGEGPLRLQLTKFDHTFAAEITPEGARVTMKVGEGPETEIGKHAFGAAKSGTPMRVEFANVDYRVALRLDGKEVVASTPERYRPDVRMLKDAYDSRRELPFPTVQISAANQVAELSHVSLWRDVYYLNQLGGATGVQRAIPYAFPERVVHLKKEAGKNEYFVLGDNSLVSADGRYWSYGINLPDEDLQVEAGLVPERFLLGKAFFVYWPAGYRPTPNAPGLIPNFGDMRFIH